MKRGNGISFIVVTKVALMTGHTPASAAGFRSAVYSQGGAPGIESRVMILCHFQPIEWTYTE